MVIGAVVALHFQLTGPIYALGWSTVAVYVFLAAQAMAVSIAQANKPRLGSLFQVIHA